MVTLAGFQRYDISDVDTTNKEGDIGLAACTLQIAREVDTTIGATVCWQVFGAEAGPNATDGDFEGGTLPIGKIDFAAEETTMTVTDEGAGHVQDGKTTLFCSSFLQPPIVNFGQTWSEHQVRSPSPGFIDAGVFKKVRMEIWYSVARLTSTPLWIPTWKLSMRCLFRHGKCGDHRKCRRGQCP